MGLQVAMNLDFHLRRFHESTVNIGYLIKKFFNISMTRDHRRITRIVKRHRRASLPHTDADFSAGSLRNVILQIVQRTIIDMHFREPKTHSWVVIDSTAQRLTPELTNTAIRLLMTEKKLYGLKSLVSNCIGFLDVYG